MAHSGHGPDPEPPLTEEAAPADKPASSHSLALHGGATEVFLFEKLYTSSTEEFFFACLVIAFLSFLLEIGRYYATKVENQLLLSRKLITRGENQDCSTFPPFTLQQQVNSTLVPPQLSPLKQPRCYCASTSFRDAWLWIVTGISHFSTHIVAVLFMLIAMTYNIYLILSLSFGATCGKLLVIYLKRKIV